MTKLLDNQVFIILKFALDYSCFTEHTCFRVCLFKVDVNLVPWIFYSVLTTDRRQFSTSDKPDDISSNPFYKKYKEKLKHMQEYV